MRRRVYKENKATTPEVRDLLDWMVEHKIDMKTAADRAGVGHHTIKDWRAGRATPKPYFLNLVKVAVGYPEAAHAVDA